MKALKRKEFIDHGSTLSPQILDPPHLALSSLDPQTRSSFWVPLHLEGHIKFPNKSKKAIVIVLVIIIIVIVKAIVIAQLGTALLISVRPTSWWVMLLRVWGLGFGADCFWNGGSSVQTTGIEGTILATYSVSVVVRGQREILHACGTLQSRV